MATPAWIRDGYRSLNPYIVVDRVEPLLAFLTEVLGGEERASASSAETERSGTPSSRSATRC
jgi:uncharacterized glyoxalase superfamily protein PhnB